MHGLLAEHAAFRAERGKRTFRRVADAGVFALVVLNDARVVTEDCGPYEFLELVVHPDRLAVLIDELTVGSVAVAFDVYDVGAVIEHLDRHLVLCERTRLIGADNVDAAERLYREEPLYDGVALCHLGHADGQNDRNDCRQTFRDGCNCEGYCRHHGVGPFELLHENIHHEDDYTNDDADDCEDLTK